MSTIRLEHAHEGRVATITVNRPPLNILDIATNVALVELLGALALEEQLAVVVLRGDGPKAFCAGVAVEDHTPERLPTMLGAFHAVVRGFADLPALTIAAVHGHCLGGGLELAAACDFVVADEKARFALPEIKLGCFPPVAAAWWPQRVGWSRSLELMTLGTGFDAPTAERLGLVSRLAPNGELEAAVASLVDGLLAQSTPVLRLTKRAARIGATSTDPVAALAATERLYLDDLTQVADMEEGVAAFFAKRPPTWEHR